MTTPETLPEEIKPFSDADAIEHADERRRRTWLLLLLLLLLLLCCLGYFITRYLIKPQPINDMLPMVGQVVNYPPSYKATINGVDGPVGVALSPDNQRLYVVESKGDRLVKVFDRNGTLIFSFSAPNTTVGGRQPFYIAVDASGRVFLADRISNSIQIFDADGKFIDAIISPDLTITRLLSRQFPDGLPEGTTFFKGMDNLVYYLPLGQKMQSMAVPKSEKNWAPLGIRFDRLGNLIYSDLTETSHTLNVIPAAALASLKDFNPQILTFSSRGQEPGQLDFPQTAVTDSRGNFYVSDGNNARITVFKPDGSYSKFFAFGSGNSGLNLPRGMWMDDKDHLHVADAVGSFVRVYDVSGEEPVFLYNFGTFGISEEAFNYPHDIIIDGTRRLYIADKGNDRIQVWSY